MNSVVVNSSSSSSSSSSHLRRLPSSSRSGRISFSLPLSIPSLSLPNRLPNLTVPFIRSIPSCPKRFRSLLKTVQQNLLDLTNATHESLKAKFNAHRQPRPTWYERMRHLLNLPPLTDRAAVLYGLELPRNRKTKSSTSTNTSSCSSSPFDKPMSTAKYDKLADEAFYNGNGKLYTHWNQAEQCFFQSRYPPQPPPTPWMEQDPKTKKWKKARRAA